MAIKNRDMVIELNDGYGCVKIALKKKYPGWNIAFSPLNDGQAGSK